MTEFGKVFSIWRIPEIHWKRFLVLHIQHVYFIVNRLKQISPSVSWTALIIETLFFFIVTILLKNFSSLGRSYIITTPKSLSNVVDALVQKFQMGVVINFEKIGGPDKPAEGELFNSTQQGKQTINKSNKNIYNCQPTANSSTVNSDMEGEGKPKNHANVSKPPSDMSG